uniref:CAZy families GT4 protein n=1 Tax=uncultured Rhodococcus sp. TaxID=194249 RepID=A0A060BX27_9NOCA|nr:CAZy families GT4 protein [uncultured Rhodococcus sp.]
MAVGVPVVVASTSALVEVAGPAGIMVGTDPASIAEGIEHALSAGFDREGTIAAGKKWASAFTWESSVRAHADVWRSVAS